MTKFAISCEELDLSSLRYSLQNFLSELPDSRIDGSEDDWDEDAEFAIHNKQFEAALKKSPELRNWWSKGAKLPAGTFCAGVYPVREDGKLLGKVELLIEKKKAGPRANFVLSTDSQRVRLEELSLTVDFYWSHCEPAKDDLWFAGENRRKCRLKRGLIEVARGDDATLFVATDAGIVPVCPLQTIQRLACCRSIEQFVSIWKSDHQLRGLADPIITNYRQWITAGKSIEELTASCDAYIKAHKRLIKSIRNESDRYFPQVFLEVATSLKSLQFVYPLYQFIMREMYSELCGHSHGDKSEADEELDDEDFDDNVLWHEDLMPFDIQVLEIVHEQLLASLPKGAKHQSLRELVEAKVKWEQRKAKNVMKQSNLKI